MRPIRYGYEMRPVDDIAISGQNPAQRTRQSALRRLEESIAARGIITPLIVDQDGILVDGHRRLACAKRLGISHVPVVVVHDSDGSLYPEINDSLRRWQSVEWLYRHQLGGTVPERQRRNIELIAELCGPELLALMADTRQSPHAILTIAKFACRRMDIDPLDRAFFGKTISWLVRRRYSSRVYRSLGDGMPPDYLYRCISEDKAIEEERHWK